MNEQYLSNYSKKELLYCIIDFSSQSWNKLGIYQDYEEASKQYEVFKSK